MKSTIKYKIWNNSKKRFEDEFEYPKDKRNKIIDRPEKYFLDLQTSEVFFEQLDTNGVIAYAEDVTQSEPKDEIILLPYIGRKDCSGNELFKGCIVELFGDYLNNYWDVVWNKKSAGFEFVIRGMQYDTEYISNFNDENILIVGNIYQNNSEFKND